MFDGHIGVYCDFLLLWSMFTNFYIMVGVQLFTPLNNRNMYVCPSLFDCVVFLSWALICLFSDRGSGHSLVNGMRAAVILTACMQTLLAYVIHVLILTNKTYLFME